MHPLTRSDKSLRLILLSLIAMLLLAAPMGAAFAQDDDGGVAGAALTLVCAGILFLVNIAILVWVYQDANKRGTNGCLWAIVVFFLGLIGLILYILLRPKQ
jgi:hypothetical protein